jgi:hypothetical protein
MTDYIDELNKKKGQLANQAYDAYEKYVGPIPVKTRSDGSTFRDTHNSKVDAFRHAYASGIMAMEYGENIANALGQGYELKGEYDNYKLPDGPRKQSTEQIIKENNMDLWNNKIGRDASIGCKSREQFVSKLVESLKDGKFITNPSDTRNYNLLIAQKIGDNYIAYGLDENHVAAKYGVPVDRVIENYQMNNDDGAGRPATNKIFTIIPEAKLNKVFDQEKYQKTINNIFDLLNKPEINNPKLTNADRFRILAKQEEESGEIKFAPNFNALANQLDMAAKFLGNMKFNNNDDEAEL